MIAPIKEKINIKILKNLRSHPATKRIFLCLNEREHQFLVNRYNLNNKFKNCNEFINDFKLKRLERFFLNKQKISINLKSFKIKNTSARPFEIYDKKLETLKYKEEDKISIKFTIKTDDLSDKKKKRKYENVLDGLICEYSKNVDS